MYIAIVDSVGSDSDENSDNISSEYIEKVRFYNNDPALPVYRWGLLNGLATDDVAAILLKEQIHLTKIATRVPTCISKNTAFVVDSTKLLNGEDIRCDDMGSWIYTGSKTFSYYLDEDGKVHRDSENHKEYQLSRQFFKNKSLPSLRKVIITAQNVISKIANDLCFIQYIFSDGEQNVVVQAHGNQKKLDSTIVRGCRRTMKSTKDLIEEKLTVVPLREAAQEVIKERGGIMKINNAGEFPRNRSQVYNINKKTKSKKSGVDFTHNDPLLRIITKAREEQMGRAENIFIREVPLFPEPIVFLASDQQLEDIERFCTNPARFCILGVDATFQIAGFYFTFATYRNLMLKTKRGNHPVFIGPGILHKQKLYTSYKTLPLLMSKYRAGTSNVLVYGTDGEDNMAKAFSDVYSNAKHLRCDIHMKDNIKRKLSQLNITGDVASEIMSDVFGKKIDGGKEGGLVDCCSSEEFDSALISATQNWITIHENGKDFVNYFFKEKADVIRETARADIRSVCGLGYPPKAYTQNANECMNRLIKADETPSYSKKEAALLPYIEKIRREIVRQQEDQFLSLIGRGPYQITDEFSFLEVEEQTFYSMTDTQKKSLKKKFFSMKMTETSRPPATGPITTQHMSVRAEDAQIIDIPFPILKRIFDKAAFLSSEPSYVMKMPTSSNDHPTFMVHSSSSENPHKVLAFPESGKFSCDQSCTGWKLYSLCSHTVAVAETLKLLKEFLKWFKKRKKPPNLTTLANINMPQNKGSKRGTRKRKGAANKLPTDGLTVLSKRLTQSHVTSNQSEKEIPPSNFQNQHRTAFPPIVLQYDALPTGVPLQHVPQSTIKAHQHSLNATSQQSAWLSNIMSQQSAVTSNMATQQGNRSSNLILQQSALTSNMAAQQGNRSSNLIPQQSALTSNIAAQQGNRSCNLTSQQSGLTSNMAAQQGNGSSNLIPQQSAWTSNIAAQQGNRSCNLTSQQSAWTSNMAAQQGNRLVVQPDISTKWLDIQHGG